MSAETETGSLLFVDTNILVYAYDRSAGEKHSTARQILEQCWENQNGCASIQVLQEFYVTVTRKIPTPIDPMMARRILADLAVWRFHSPEANDLLQAIDLQRDHQLSFWDAMIVQSARSLGCQRLLSEDLRHGMAYSGVRAINPFL
jgi:predicted nucleic acid-binding protein